MLVGALHGLLFDWTGTVWEQLAAGILSNAGVALPTAVAALSGARFVPAWRQTGTAFLLGVTRNLFDKT